MADPDRRSIPSAWRLGRLFGPPATTSAGITRWRAVHEGGARSCKIWLSTRASIRRSTASDNRRPTHDGRSRQRHEQRRHMAPIEQLPLRLPLEIRQPAGHHHIDGDCLYRRPHSSDFPIEPAKKGVPRMALRGATPCSTTSHCDAGDSGSPRHSASTKIAPLDRSICDFFELPIVWGEASQTRDRALGSSNDAALCERSGSA